VVATVKLQIQKIMLNLSLIFQAVCLLGFHSHNKFDFTLSASL